MSDWEESKQNFIDKLGNADRIFDEIFKADSEGLVIQGDEREELKNLQTANKKILNKLKSREFTVAIVGLEKAGKSTLGNALINSMVLPEYAALHYNGNSCGRHRHCRSLFLQPRRVQ